MAHAKITQSIKDSFGSGDGGNPAAFYSEADIDIVLGQPGAFKLRYIRAIIGSDHCTVAIGVNTFSDDGAEISLDNVDDYMALPCPPWLDPDGGQLITFE